MVEKSSSSGLWPQMFDPFRNLGTRVHDWLSPASEASSNGDGYRITMELPGVAEDDIDISVHDGVVSIKGEKKTERQEKGETWFFTERQYGAFSRNFRLPADADQEKVDADLKDGILTITVAQKKPGDAGGAKKVSIKKA